MARKSAEQKSAEKKEIKEIRADQDQEVIDMYTDIASMRDSMRNLTPAVQQNEDALNMWFDVTFPSSGKKATAKGRHHPYQAIKKLRARFTATQLEMDQFEKTLTDEWAVEQRKSWQERDEYLERKVTEMNEYCRKYKIEVKMLLSQAEIRVTGLNDDEVWDEKGKAAAGKEEGAEAGEEAAGKAAPATDEEDEGEAALATDEENEGEDALATDEEDEGEAAPVVEEETGSEAASVVREDIGREAAFGVEKEDEVETALVVEEVNEGEGAPVVEEDGDEAEATDDDRDEKSDTEKNLDTEEKSDPLEAKPGKEEKKGKKKTKKPKRKPNKGKRR